MQEQVQLEAGPDGEQEEAPGEEAGGLPSQGEEAVPAEPAQLVHVAALSAVRLSPDRVHNRWRNSRRAPLLIVRMRRPAFMAVLLLGTLTGFSAAPAWTGSGDSAVRRPAFVSVVECSRGPKPADRHATFRAAVRRVAHTERMWMRLVVQERVGDGRFRTVKAAGLGTWRKSQPAVRRFSHRQRVLELAEGAVYRAVVSFRWYDAEGELIQRATRRSKPCRQPGLLPNLSVVRIDGGQPLSGAPGSSSYTVRVVNRGRAIAPRFGISLAVDHGMVDTQSVAPLAPGEVRQLVFAGPVCAGSLTARADPDDVVREVSEHDNVLTVPCPLRP